MSLLLFCFYSSHLFSSLLFSNISVFLFCPFISFHHFQFPIIPTSCCSAPIWQYRMTSTTSTLTHWTSVCHLLYPDPLNISVSPPLPWPIEHQCVTTSTLTHWTSVCHLLYPDPLNISVSPLPWPIEHQCVTSSTLTHRTSVCHLLYLDPLNISVSPPPLNLSSLRWTPPPPHLDLSQQPVLCLYLKCFNKIRLLFFFLFSQCPPSVFSILSYPILSYPILSYPTLSYPIPFYPILSYPILSYSVIFHCISYLSPFFQFSVLTTWYSWTYLMHCINFNVFRSLYLF